MNFTRRLFGSFNYVSKWGIQTSTHLLEARGAGSAGAMAPQDFGRSVSPISTRGGRLSMPIEFRAVVWPGKNHKYFKKRKLYIPCQSFFLLVF